MSLTILLRKFRAAGSLDDVDAQARSLERLRRIALSIVAAFLARGMNILVLLATIPLTLRYLGSEKFGMWATLSALSGLLSVTDFGVSNSLITSLARSAHAGQHRRLRKLISSAYAFIGLFSIALFAVGFGIIFLVNWRSFFNVSSPSAAHDATAAAAVFLCAMILANPLTLIYRVQQGLQEGYRAGAWQAAGSVATLLGVLGAIWLHGSLPLLIAALVGTPLLFALANTVHYFGWVRPTLRPSLALVRRRIMRILGGVGSSFLVIQISAAVLFQANNIVIAQVIGASSVPVYSVPERMFSLITVVVALLLAPFWPAFGDASKRGDRQWIVSTFRRVFRIGVAGAAAASGCLFLLGPWLVAVWVHRAVAPPPAIFAGLALWKLLETAGAIASILLNAMGAVKVQALAGAMTAVLALGFSIFFTSKYGVAGAVFGTVASYLLCGAPIITMAVLRELRRLQRLDRVQK